MKCLYLIILSLIIALTCPAQKPTLVADLSASGDSKPRLLFTYNNKLFFAADSDLNQYHLYSYDTSKGASTVVPASNLNLKAWSTMDIFNGKLCLSMEARTAGGDAVKGIYQYDGLNPVAPAPGVDLDSFLNIFEMKAAGGKLYIGATRTAAKNELWCYTGSGRATQINIAPSYALGSSPSFMMEHDGKLFFMGKDNGGNDRLYVLNPADNSFGILSSSDYPAGFTGAPPVYLSTPGKLYFISSGDTVGRELFVYDGSTIKRISDFTGTGGEAGGPICKYGDDIYFSGAPDGRQHQLYRYSTTTGIVSLAATVNPGGDSQFWGMIVYHGKLYFGASSAATGREIWSFDGTKLSLVADLCPGSGDGLDTWPPSNFGTGVFAEYKGSLYFAGNNCAGKGTELYRFNDLESTGISRVSWDGSVQAFPNPVISSASLAITLNKPQSLSVSLTDMQGRQVWTSQAHVYQSGRQVLTVPMQHLASGQYFFRIADANGQLLSGTTVMK